MDLEKVQAMLAFPNLNPLRELCGFLGLNEYCQKFVLNYAKIKLPLIERRFGGVRQPP